MNGFRVLVVDDEPLARHATVTLLSRDAEVVAVAECGDPRRVSATITEQVPDIVFLDIEMPEIDGLQIAEQLGAEGPVVVFVTAFGRYAPQAFDVSAVDYVIKPFSDERFFQALARAKKRVRERRLGSLVTQVASLSAEMEPQPKDSPDARGATPGAAYLQRLAFRDGTRQVVIKASEIVWIEAEDYYVRVHSTRGSHLVRSALAVLETRLDPASFVRVHRRAMINLDEVREVYRDGELAVLLSSGARVPISRSRWPHVEGLLLPRIR
jgi:two-component system LytT family response regulator